MFTLSSKITIGKVVFPFVADVEIRSDWREMTDTAIIKIAKKIRVKGTDLVTRNLIEVIKTGDAVKIELGYNGKLKTEFVGYVARSPMPTMPLEIHCEDEMWKLKRLPVKTKTLVNSKVSDLLKYIAPDYANDALDSELGRNYLIENGTAAAALKKLEEVFGLKSFFRMVNGIPVLCVGRPYGSKDLLKVQPVKYHFQKNVKSNTLEYRTADDLRIKVKAICKVHNGKDLKVEVGDADGDIRTQHYVNVSLATLTENAKADLAKFKADGYRGDITSFGLPSIRSGMQAALIDEQYEKRTADIRYHIDAVTKKFGENGFENTITLGWKASAESSARFK